MVNLLRRELLATILGSQGRAANWPGKSIKLIVPFARGGSTDRVARLFAQALGKILDVGVAIDNLPGSGGIRGADALCRSAPDGHTIGVIGAGPMVVAPHLSRLPYDPRNSFDPVSLISTSDLLWVVRSSYPHTTVGAIISHCATNPRLVSYGTSGIGGMMHAAALQLECLMGIDLVHAPYRGGQRAVAALLRGEVDMVFANPIDVVEAISLKELTVVASTGLTASQIFGVVPLMSNSGIAGYHVENWNGVFAPKGTPAHVREIISSVLSIYLNSDEAKSALASLGSTPVSCRPDELSYQITTDIERWSKIFSGGHLDRR